MSFGVSVYAGQHRDPVLGVANVSTDVEVERTFEMNPLSPVLRPLLSRRLFFERSLLAHHRCPSQIARLSTTNLFFVVTLTLKGNMLRKVWAVRLEREHSKVQP